MAGKDSKQCGRYLPIPFSDLQRAFPGASGRFPVLSRIPVRISTTVLKPAHTLHLQRVRNPKKIVYTYLYLYQLCKLYLFVSPSDVEHLTHLALTLLSLGNTDIYSRTCEEQTGNVDRSWVPLSADVKYEYKWDVSDMTGQQGQVFGPYSEEMLSWYKASYFGSSGEKVKARPVGGDWGAWPDCL